MSPHPLTMSRTGAFACVAALHAGLIYAIAVSIGGLDVPLSHEFQARFIVDDKPLIHEIPIIPPSNLKFSTEPVIAKEVLPPLIDEPPAVDRMDPVVIEPWTAHEHEPGNEVEKPVRLITAVPLITHEPAYPVASIHNSEQGVVTVKVNGTDLDIYR